MTTDFSELLRQLNQARKDYWYEGEEPDPAELATYLTDVEALVEAAEKIS